ncbi:HAD family hydrolase [Labilibacter sediminis]|nr:HAD family hydrolase [Labilibacter sediminis]
MMKFKYVAFDADDTLWVNESYFRETEAHFSELLAAYGDAETITNKLLEIEIRNIELYGYGVKGFILSMIETGISVTNGSLPEAVISKIIELGKELLNKPVVLLDGIEEVLKALQGKGYKLVVATKGDLLDQERKLYRSNIEKYFHHIEVMSDKKEANYLKLLAHLDITPDEFLMIGNSLKSDVLPVLNIGASAVHVPFHTTWIHEEAELEGNPAGFAEIEKVSDLIEAMDL